MDDFSNEIKLGLKDIDNKHKDSYNLKDNNILTSIEINLIPNKYLNTEERYLRAKLLNNKANSSNITLEIMHDRYNDDDSLALEVYYNHVMIGYIQKYNRSVNINNFCFINNQIIKDLTLKWENNKFYLSKKVQFTIQNKVNTHNLYPKWMVALFYWADTNNIDAKNLPRTKEITSLTSLNIENNQLTELPKEIGNLTRLTSLNIKNNQLTELPKEIGNLTSLIWFGIENNQLTELPKEIGNLTSLTSLNIKNNQLTELPKEIGNLTSLTWLGIENNKYTSKNNISDKKSKPWWLTIFS